MLVELFAQSSCTISSGKIRSFSGNILLTSINYYQKKSIEMIPYLAILCAPFGMVIRDPFKGCW